MNICTSCDGHGIVPDYGPFGLDFYGPKECPECNGAGTIIENETDKGIT